MGCAGSKNEVHQSEHANLKDVDISDHKPKEKNLKESEEDQMVEIQVIEEGKSINKTVLDEIIEKKLTLKNNEKIIQSPTSKQRLDDNLKNSSSHENSKNSNALHDSVHNEIDNYSQQNLAENKSNKLAFENHPHEFDFSFIEEKKESQEVNLEDELLEEMRDIN